MKKLIAVLLFAACAFAQDCPVKFTTVDPRDITHKGDGWTFHLNVKWTNSSEKVIKGVKFGASFIDSVGDVHPTYENWTSDQKAKPGDTKRSVWHDDYYIRQYGHPDVEIWPLKVLFEDGSTWEPDELGQCSARGKS
jgi:hypothetical protein